TADVIARMAAGRADDLLTATVLVATCPVIVVPAMHTEMWFNPAPRDNVATLRRRGITVMDPAHGRLTGVDTGPGRLPEPEQIARLALLAAERPGAFARDLEGRRVVISAGGTREAIDPVRFIGDHSSGRQGYALAEVAAQRGAEVTLVAGSVDELPVPAGATVRRIVSARELADAMAEESAGAGAVIMSAAGAGFRPAAESEAEPKKGNANEGRPTHPPGDTP